MEEPNFDNVPYQAHAILVNELEDASQELKELLTFLIENSELSEAKNPIRSVEDLINFLEDHTIYTLEELLGG